MGSDLGVGPGAVGLAQQAQRHEVVAVRVLDPLELDLPDVEEDLVAVADRIGALELDEGEAEVAFVVADEHQGRGLGPILLEHLAGAAAENGFTRFEAEVLAENRYMVNVFKAAGYELRRSFDGSVVHVEFGIDPTEALTNVRNSRESAADYVNFFHYFKNNFRLP